MRARSWLAGPLHCTRASRRRYFGRLGHSALPGPLDVSALAWLAVGSRRVGRMRGYSGSQMDSNDRAVQDGQLLLHRGLGAGPPLSLGERGLADDPTVGVSDRTRCVTLAFAVDAHAASARCHVHCVHCRDRRSRLMSYHMRFHAGTPLPLPLSIAGRAWQQLRCLAKCCMLHAMLSTVLHLARLTPHCRCASPSTSPAHDPFSSARTNHGRTPTLPLPLPPASDLQRFAFGCAHNFERAARRPL